MSHVLTYWMVTYYARHTALQYHREDVILSKCPCVSSDLSMSLNLKPTQLLDILSLQDSYVHG